MLLGVVSDLNAVSCLSVLEIEARNALVRSIRHNDASPEFDQQVLDYLRTATPLDHPILVETAIDHVIARKPEGFKSVLIDIQEDRIHVRSLEGVEKQYAVGIRKTIIAALPKLLELSDINILAGIQRGWGRNEQGLIEKSQSTPRVLFHDFAVTHKISTKELIEMLKDPDPGMRTLAVSELIAQSEGNEADIVQPLIVVVRKDIDPFVRVTAMEHPYFLQESAREVLFQSLLEIVKDELPYPTPCHSRGFRLLKLNAFKSLVHLDVNYWSLLLERLPAGEESALHLWLRNNQNNYSNEYLTRLKSFGLPKVSKLANEILSQRLQR